jgi:hypothetical protein
MQLLHLHLTNLPVIKPLHVRTAKPRPLMGPRNLNVAKLARIRDGQSEDDRRPGEDIRGYDETQVHVRGAAQVAGERLVMSPAGDSFTSTVTC